MEISIFNVGLNPYCVWEVNLKDKNVDYIRSIDHEYFTYQAEAHLSNLETEKKLNAALSLRIALYHGMETLFSLISSMLQAPDCVYGWMLKYSIKDLRTVVENLHKKKGGFPHKWQTSQRLTWNLVSESVHSHSNENPDRVKETSDLFASFWQKLCILFLDEKNINEYNSIKHGYRAQSAGFSISVGKEDTPGVPAPKEKMVNLGGSPYGSTFLISEKIKGEDIKGDPNFTTKSQSLNWDAESLGYSLVLISDSIHNIKSHLLILNGIKPQDVMFTRPQDSEYFQMPWNKIPGVSASAFNLVLDDSRVKKFTKQQLKEYTQKNFKS